MHRQETTPAVRHDGWTPERQVRFLDSLASRGNVRLACGRVGLSAEAAYRLRRRDPLFARGWAVALLKAREVTEQVIADRAIDGIEEKVWHRGELIDIRRKYDNRLLLAHMARLDRLADEMGASADAARFDELLACIAGETVPRDLESDGGILPLEREAAAARGGARGEHWWDVWFDNACSCVDWASGWGQEPPASGLPGNPLPPELAQAIETAAKALGLSFPRTPSTSSTPSTSAFARSLAKAAAEQPPIPNRAARRAMRAKQRRGRK